MSSSSGSFAAARQALEQARPTGWRWPDKNGNQHDGSVLVGEYVGDSESDRHPGVPIKRIRTEDGRYRDLYLWAPDEGEPAEYHLGPRWGSASPNYGDYVAVERCEKDSTQNLGQKYFDHTVAVVRASGLTVAEPPAGEDDVPF